MNKRTLGPFQVAPMGLGCMNLSHAYGIPPDERVAERLLLSAVDAGVTLFDTAALYGFGTNESLVGRILAPYRQHITLSSKCGMQGIAGKRVIDGRPETLKRTCEESLLRLQTDVIDLYYLHRWDKSVPIEDSVGALADLVHAGKIRSIGLSEVSTHTLKTAHAIYPIAAVQTEYSLWTRNPELGILHACRELGIACVAFSPLGRGFLAGALPNLRALQKLANNDIRRAMPRFYPEHFERNLSVLIRIQALAVQNACTPAQLALAWLLAQGEHIIPIPGTTQELHLLENIAAVDVTLTEQTLHELNSLLETQKVFGARYNAATQLEIDTEESSVHII